MVVPLVPVAHGLVPGVGVSKTRVGGLIHARVRSLICVAPKTRIGLVRVALRSGVGVASKTRVGICLVPETRVCLVRVAPRSGVGVVPRVHLVRVGSLIRAAPKTRLVRVAVSRVGSLIPKSRVGLIPKSISLIS